MNNDFLKRLYWACSDESANGADGTNFCEMYERIKETKSESRYFSEALYATGLTVSEKRKLESLNSSIAMVYEQQGFINGFRLGMKLAGELKEEAVT